MEREKRGKADKILLVLILVISLFGLLMVANASAIIAQENFGDQFYFLKRQAIWWFLGIFSLILTSNLSYQQLEKIASPLFFFSLVLTTAVLIPGLGQEKLGAKRWLAIGSFTFQPTELAKLALVCYGAFFFSPQEKKEKKKSWPFLLMVFLIAGLTMAEPDLGTTTVLFATGLLICFLAGISSLKIFLITLLALAGGTVMIFISPYRRQRMLTFLNPAQDLQKTSYHIHQILLSLGSGGLFGQGLGHGKQKYAYLPEVATDSIFAIIAEELGFVGATIIIILLALLVFRCFHIAARASNLRGKLLAGGVGGWLGLQTLINLGGIVSLIPLTGIPLPLISYGGSSLLVTLAALGLVLGVSREKR
ncbi:putative lipid II flippase FtsW [Candidatus Shapirobacteria bacterium]|nr:putative lipid II flippase FtsW [Candidatus Shapirobacteria bacterium]